MRTFFYILILSSCLNFPLQAQTYFNRVYGYTNTNTFTNHATTSIELDNGDFLIGGNKFLPGFGALHFLRINANGDTVITKNYPKIDCGYYTAVGVSLIKCFDGNFVQAGAYTDSGSSDPDALLIKLTENGDTLWTKTYGGANFDNANTVCQTSDSGFVLMGVTQSFSTGSASDFYLIKTDKNGNQQWQRNYGTTAAEDCVSGQITLDGGYIMSGIRSSTLYILKTDASGNFQWDKQFAATAGTGFVKQLQDSTYLVVGAKLVTGLSYQAYMAKLTKTGAYIWQKTYGGANDQQFYTVPIILNDGSIVCAGEHTASSNWGLLIKTDSAGNQQWLRTYYANPSNNSYVYDLKATSDNGFIMVGSGNITGQDAWVVKVDEFGCEVSNCNVGVNEFHPDSYRDSDQKLILYPNPASNKINLEISDLQISDLQVSVINILGEVQNVQIMNSAIDISQLAEGVYFVSVTDTDGRRWVEKFIKQ